VDRPAQKPFKDMQCLFLPFYTFGCVQIEGISADAFDGPRLKGKARKVRNAKVVAIRKPIANTNRGLASLECRVWQNLRLQLEALS